ncbi:hypothetical protein MRB53_013970 [Persea americana]|uniref:Uncharacterized protein n=1 Tax=Persea americana TaxID=3435 RepID=A0ACC2K9G3_PERAE|nr:hypothetical protein MRB53_013970 [Persea americana]
MVLVERMQRPAMRRAAAAERGLLRAFGRECRVRWVAGPAVACDRRMSGAGGDVRASAVSLRREMMEGAKGHGAAAVDDGAAA